MTHMIKTQTHYGYSPFSADPRGIEERLSDKTRLIFLENPNHTTGTIYSRGELVYLLEHAGEAVVVLDEFYADYIGGSSADLVGKYANLIIIGGFPILSGLDIEPLGYIMADHEIMQNFTNDANTRDLTMKQLATAIAALNNIQNVRDQIETVRENIIFLSAKLRSLGVSCRISPIDFLLAKVANPRLVAAELRREGIAVHEIDYLPQLTGYISIAVDDDTSGVCIAEAFERMPGHYYAVRKAARSRMTIRRRPEERTDRTEKDREKTDVVAGSIDDQL
jgi:histidinol-phosphate aminotransferase